MMKRFVFIILFLMTSNSLVNAQADPLTSNDPPYYCPNKNGAFYQANLFPRYDINTHSLVLIDATTNQLARTLDTFDDNVRIINWSPDCRYLTGSVGEMRHGYQFSDYARVEWNYHSTAIWDALNGGRINSVQDAGRYSDYVHESPVIWSSNSAYALILSGCPTAFYGCQYEREQYDFIWSRATNSAYRAGNYSDAVTSQNFNGRIYLEYQRGWANFNQYYWDMNWGWLWGSGYGTTFAYDLNTGAEIHSFKIDSGGQTRFVLSTDHTKVVVYNTLQSGGGLNGAITIYDIDSQASVAVNVEGFAAPEIPLANYHPIALSADNRYLAVGHDAIRVWDIQNLPEKFEDRLPIYRHAGPKALIQSLRFSDWGVIETNSKEGIQHWDLHTGAFISEAGQS